MVGFIYFFIHMMLEVICFTTLQLTTGAPVGYSLLTYILVYDFLAFVPQALWGEVKTHLKKIDLLEIAVVLLAGGLVFLMVFKGNLWGIVIMAIGNAALHEDGAFMTTRDKKIFPAALFVSGGSFGVVIGTNLGKLSQWYYPLMIMSLLFCIIIYVLGRYSRQLIKEDHHDIHIVRENLDPVVVILVALFITTVRSFISYAIPMSWKKEIWQSFLLFFVMGFGKAIGGYLCDHFNIRKMAVISSLICIPFLIFGQNNMLISIIGICTFSLTMAVTYAMALSVIENVGIAFGLTTVGLFLGALPVSLTRISFTLNVIIVVTLSILCAILFYIVLKKEN